MDLSKCARTAKPTVFGSDRCRDARFLFLPGDSSPRFHGFQFPPKVRRLFNLQPVPYGAFTRAVRAIRARTHVRHRALIAASSIRSRKKYVVDLNTRRHSRVYPCVLNMYACVRVVHLRFHGDEIDTNPDARIGGSTRHYRAPMRDFSFFFFPFFLTYVNSFPLTSIKRAKVFGDRERVLELIVLISLAKAPFVKIAIRLNARQFIMRFNMLSLVYHENCRKLCSIIICYYPLRSIASVGVRRGRWQDGEGGRVGRIARRSYFSRRVKYHRTYPRTTLPGVRVLRRRRYVS